MNLRKDHYRANKYSNDNEMVLSYFVNRFDYNGKALQYVVSPLIGIQNKSETKRNVSFLPKCK